MKYIENILLKLEIEIQQVVHWSKMPIFVILIFLFSHTLNCGI